MKWMFEYIYEDAWEIGQVFFFKLDKEINELTICEDEVEQVKWLNFDEFKELLYSDEWIPIDREYKNLVVKAFEDTFRAMLQN